jgi:glutamate synthase (NADPH/NADH) large chain
VPLDHLQGLFLAESLSVFYPDLTDDRFESRVAIFHQRYSTNTFPQWWLAQPFRTLAHNGEINTIRGNKNWMKSHEIKMASLAFGDQSEDIKPVIPAGASDTAALDAVFEALCPRGPRCADHQADAGARGMAGWPICPRRTRTCTTICLGDGAVGRPRRPRDDRWPLGGRGCGPQRAASAALYAHVRQSAHRRFGNRHGRGAGIERGAEGPHGPGEMLAVDLDEGVVYHDRAIKDRIAAERPMARWSRASASSAICPPPLRGPPGL